MLSEAELKKYLEEEIVNKIDALWLTTYAQVKRIYQKEQKTPEELYRYAIESLYYQLDSMISTKVGGAESDKLIGVYLFGALSPIFGQIKNNPVVQELQRFHQKRPLKNNLAINPNPEPNPNPGPQPKTEEPSDESQKKRAEKAEKYERALIGIAELIIKEKNTYWSMTNALLKRDKRDISGVPEQLLVFEKIIEATLQKKFKISLEHLIACDASRKKLEAEGGARLNLLLEIHDYRAKSSKPAEPVVPKPGLVTLAFGAKAQHFKDADNNAERRQMLKKALLEAHSDKQGFGHVQTEEEDAKLKALTQLLDMTRDNGAELDTFLQAYDKAKEREKAKAHRPPSPY